MDAALLSQIFDANAFRKALADTPSALPLFKTALKDAQNAMDEHFRKTLDAVTLVNARAWFMDQLLAIAWEQYFVEIATSTPDDIALLAVGGYGRGELHPKSDIDVLLLLKDETAFDKYKEPMQMFVTFLWDLKLDVGHGVRTLEDCHREAEKDLTIVTNLMETRTLTGCDLLRNQMLELTGPKSIWPSHEFFLAKWDEQVERHKKHHDLDYNLEPNLKNCQGGLRDIHTIVWMLHRHYGDKQLSDLVSRGILTDFEYEILHRCRDFLWQLRYALHMVTQREEDQLLFDYQQEIADILGFEEEQGKLGVENMMHQYYRYGVALTELNDLLLLRFKEVIVESQQPAEIEVISEHFQRHNGYLEIRDPQLFEHTPSAMLEVFYVLATDDSLKGVRANTIRALRDNRHLIDDDFRSKPNNIRTFMAFIRSPNHVVRELDRMMRYGILGQYIPEFGQIIGHMQHDLLHVYTLDQHTFRAIQFLREMRHTPDKQKFPLASKLVHRIPKKEVLYIAALLHDVGKGLPGEHEETGAEIAEHFCIQHGMSQKDTDLIVWLVRNHLIFSQGAQRLDTSDPDTMHHFASQIHDVIRLNHLYMLSVADIHSTNKKLWNSWRAEQMHNLYREVLRRLRRGLSNPINKEDWVEEIQEATIQLLIPRGHTEQAVRELWGDPGDDYFLRESPETLAWHAEALFKHGNSESPLVLIGETSDHEFEGATQIFIYMKDQPNLFAAMTASLDQLNLNIQDARIMTSANKNTLDTYIVLDEQNKPITNPERIAKIQKTLEEALSCPDEFPNIVKRRVPRRLKQFKFKPYITISNDLINMRTCLEVSSPDRPGLLAKMGQVFMEHNVNLQTAKILTEGERVDDIFYISDKNGEPISDPEFCETLQKALVDALNEQIEFQGTF